MSIFTMTKNISRGDVLRYVFLPQVLPRLNAFYKSGFSHLAYMIALVYRAANILPATHPVLGMRGELGLRDVLSAAAAEIQFTRKNIDKVIIYFLILLGLFLLVGQFFLTLAFMFNNPAFAAAAPTNGMPTSYSEFFAPPPMVTTGAGTTDVAYRMLFSVFGVPELFNPTGENNPFHKALHSLFQLYSVGLLVIAVIISCYFVFAILVETAQTGVPFGKRYNHVWTPIRLVFALGLLMPVGYGLNAAQWITLYAAKFGSDFANRGWIIFNDKMTESFIQRQEERVGTPQTPEFKRLAAFMMTVDGCQFAYQSMYRGSNAKNIRAYFVKNPAENGGIGDFLDSDFGDAMRFFNNGDILIRFGEYDQAKHTKYLGNVYPYCGDLVISSGDTTESGSRQIQQEYFRLVQDMWSSDQYKLKPAAEKFVKKFMIDKTVQDAATELPDSAFKLQVADQIRTRVTENIRTAVTQQANSNTWREQRDKILSYGWAGAGMWYNKIAQINGSFVTAVNNVPEGRRMPEVLEYVKRKQLMQNVRVPETFSTNLSGSREMQFEASTEEAIAKALTEIQGYWDREDADQSELGNQTKVTNNIFIDTINLIFGTRGLFNMCANTDVHPLAQLSILGKGLIEASVRNLAVGFLGAGSQFVLTSHLAAITGAASSMLLSVASMTVTIGFILFYVLPFMPFLYFFLAVGGWIKGLFEAMVGVPLWALAHLRIDGEGLPGDAAMDGYYLIFEIFLRPILILFGLLASVIIFAAMVKVLNEIFYLVVVNLSGHDENFQQLCGRLGGGGTTTTNNNNSSAVSFFRGPIDELFYTILYAIIVYMIGNSCFKLIDLVPNNLLRYMGARVQTFNDTAQNPAEGLLTRLSIGSQVVTGGVIGAARGGMTGVAKAAEGMQEIAGGGSSGGRK